MKNKPHKKQGIDTADAWQVFQMWAFPLSIWAKTVTLCALPQLVCRWIHPLANIIYLEGIYCFNSGQEKLFLASDKRAWKRGCINSRWIPCNTECSFEAKRAWNEDLFNIFLFACIMWESSISWEFVGCENSSYPVWCEVVDSASEGSMVKSVKIFFFYCHVFIRGFLEVLNTWNGMPFVAFLKSKLGAMEQAPPGSAY